MIVADEIYDNVRKLPEPLQAEVLDFVTFLLLKIDQQETVDEDAAWSRLSLETAMSDMKSEVSPDYSLSDIKESFE